MKHIYGPIPSRRLGKSLGISPIIKKACNYSCVYCQLGVTDKMTNERQEFFPVDEIIEELKEVLQSNIEYDVISIVGEGEPTLYLKLGELIDSVKDLTEKPVCVITNSALLSDRSVRNDLMHADIVLPSLDAYDDASFKKVNRPYKTLDYNEIYEGLKIFSQEFNGQIWMEIMLVKGYNDSENALSKFKEKLKSIRYDRLYINSPVRPPTVKNAVIADKKTLELFSKELNAISIDLLSEEDFQSEIKDDFEAVLSIIKRHPMNQHELAKFLEKRNNKNKEEIFEKLSQKQEIEIIFYKGYNTYRYK